MLRLWHDTSSIGFATENKRITSSFQRYLLDGYAATMIGAAGYNMLLQHYDSRQLSIHHYHIHVTKQTRLFSRSEANSIDLLLLNNGNVMAHVNNECSIQLLPQKILVLKLFFEQTMTIDIMPGKHELICISLHCNIGELLPELEPHFLHSLNKPLEIALAYWLRYQWIELVYTIGKDALTCNMALERVISMLRQLFFYHLAEESTSMPNSLYPGFKLTEIRKAYEAKRIMDTRLNETLRLKELVMFTQWNSQALKQVFAAIFKISPHRYLMRQRLNTAMHMVKYTQETVGQIALKCGFKQSHHFIRRFKETFGKTPGEMRRELWLK